MPLTADQKHTLCEYVAFGCDRETAAKCLKITWPDLQVELRADALFAIELNKAEALSEVDHVKNIKEAGTEKRHWRASQWWLERRATDRYGQRVAYSISSRELDDLVMAIMEKADKVVQSNDLSNRLVDAIMEVGEEFKAAVTASPLRAIRAQLRKKKETSPKS